MKKIMYIALVMSVLFCSCESKGPKSQYYEDTRTSDEMLQDISDASVGDGWLHKYDTDVYYMEDGEWNCYGRVSVYKNLEDDHDRNWVDFDGMKFPTEETNKGGYSYKVQYGGTWYYI